MQVFSSFGIYGWESHVYQWLVNYRWVHMLFLHANNDKLYNGKGSIILLLASIVYDISQSLHNLCHIGAAPYVIIPAWSIRWVLMHSNNNQHWHDYLRLNSEFQSPQSLGSGTPDVVVLTVLAVCIISVDITVIFLNHQ